MDQKVTAYEFETEAAVMLPEGTASGLFDQRGKLVLKIKDDRRDKSSFFEANDLSSALRDLQGSPYQIRLFTATATRVWGVFGNAFKGGGTYTFNGAWSPGALPVAGCYTEWNPALAKPMWGDANFQLWGIQVSPEGGVRIQGINAFGVKLNTAAGLVIPL
jgi:hypothetical protein